MKTKGPLDVPFEKRKIQRTHNYLTIWKLSVPLETATYIDQLVSSNPAHSDGLNNADAHLRLIKGTIQATFPNFTAVALQSTQAQLDAAVAAVVTNGVSVLSESGVSFKTNIGDGWDNPAAGEIQLTVNDTVLVTYMGSTSTVAISGSLTTAGTIQSVGAISGPGASPIGSIMIWPFDTLPTTAWGTWAWCNGAAVSRTTYATLFAGGGGVPAMGTTYGTGDGSTTFNLPNYQDVTLVGKDTMGGATSPGLLPSIATGIKNVLGKIFGADTSTLSTANLPPYTPAGTVTTTVPGGISGFTQPGSTVFVGGSASGGSIAPLLNAPSSTFAGTAQGGTSTPFNNLPPMQTTNFIIRLA